MEMMMKFASRQSNRQFIFLTPQDMRCAIYQGSCLCACSKVTANEKVVPRTAAFISELVIIGVFSLQWKSSTPGDCPDLPDEGPHSRRAADPGSPQDELNRALFCNDDVTPTVPLVMCSQCVI
jgi:hypothetical protein